MALSPETLKEHFENTNKCKINWKIEKVEKIKSTDTCLSNLKIYIKWTDSKSNKARI